MAKKGSALSDQPVPVSYTHLDVYKRQVQRHEAVFGVANGAVIVDQIPVLPLVDDGEERTVREMCIRDRSKHRSALRLCLGTAYYSARRYLLWMSGKYRFASQRQKDRLPCVCLLYTSRCV